MTYKERVASGCVDNVGDMPFNTNIFVAHGEVILDHNDFYMSLNPDEAIGLRNALLELFPVEKS